MRSLLIGADGQVGYELLHRLTRLGEVVPTTRSGQLPDGSPCRALDLLDTRLLQVVVDEVTPNLVINAAAYTAVDRAESEAQLAHAVNATAPGALAQACLRNRASLVHFSTDYIFGGTSTRPLVESDPVGPMSAYGTAKLAGEQAIRASGVTHKIFRLCWVYGPRGHNFLRTMLRLAVEREELRVVADQVGCPTPSAWIAEAVVHAVSQKPRSCGTWHLSASGSTSWHGFAEAILAEALRIGILDRSPVLRPISTSEYPTPARRPAYSVLDNSLFRRDFGLVLRDWQLGVAEVLDSMRRSSC